MVSLKAIAIKLRGGDETIFNVFRTEISGILKRMHEGIVRSDSVTSAWASRIPGFELLFPKSLHNVKYLLRGFDNFIGQKRNNNLIRNLFSIIASLWLTYSYVDFFIISYICQNYEYHSYTELYYYFLSINTFSLS